MAKRKSPAQRQGRNEIELTQAKYALLGHNAQACPLAVPVCLWCPYLKEYSQKSGGRRLYCILTGEKLVRLYHA